MTTEYEVDSTQEVKLETNTKGNSIGVFNTEVKQEEKPKIYILHHDDADGWASGAICLAAVSDKDCDVKHIAVQYEQPFPIELETLTKQDKVYILDFSYKEEILEDVKNRVKHLLVLDHHKSAKFLKDKEYAVYDETKSGVLLTWEYFIPEYPAPETVQLLDCYDLWKKNDPKYPWEKVVAFHFACMEGLKRDMSAWMGLLNGYQIPGNFWELGYHHLHILKEAISTVKEAPTTEIIQVNGKRFCLFFAEDMVSLISDGIYSDPELNVVGTGCLFKRKGNWIVSLRSKDADSFNARLFAESLGGGGHDLSAGATIGTNEDELQILDKLKDKLIKFSL